jgi:hypothetical protein
MSFTVHCIPLKRCNLGLAFFMRFTPSEISTLASSLKFGVERDQFNCAGLAEYKAASASSTHGHPQSITFQGYTVPPSARKNV